MNWHEGWHRLRTWAGNHVALIGLSVVVVAWALGLQRLGHSWGDDFTLYIRQSKSLIDGNVGQVIADNHFNVDNAAKPGFSPYVYPWSFPILLAPFYRLFGLDYARLKLVEIACLVAFLWGFLAVIRSRMQHWVAVATVVSIGTTLSYVEHTDHLLSELPYMAAVTVTLWYLDRLRRNQVLDAAGRNQLVLLGVLAMCVFNFRREGLAIVAAIVVAQLFDLRGRWRLVSWRQVFTPVLAFAGSVLLVQFLLPSALAPEYDESGLHQTWLKLQGPFRRAFATQLGFDNLGGVALLAVFLLVVAGVLVRMWRAASRDAPLLVFAVGSMTIVGMIPANDKRYLLAITPFAVYFAAQALAAVPLPRKAGHWLATAVLALLTVAHLTELPSTVRAAHEANASGQPEGPAAEYVQDAFAAIRRYTHQDDVVSFFKVRTLTLYTDRRGVQSDDLEIVRQRADYIMLLKHSNQGQPLVGEADADAMHWQAVWQDDDWVLYRLPLYESS
ncbi:MAG: hypothetical protein WCC60_21070 [Ilumatobacteraceae bacterium]